LLIISLEVLGGNKMKMDKKNVELDSKVVYEEFVKEQLSSVSWKKLSWPLRLAVLGGWLMFVSFVLEVLFILLQV
jgi:hypothetical protein